MCQAGKIYERVLNERMMKITDNSVGDDQRCFWKGRGRVDKIFALKMMVEKYLRRRGSCLLLLQTWRWPTTGWTGRAYGILWEYMGWEGIYLRGSGSMRMQVPPCMWTESWVSFSVEVGVRQGCVVSPWLFSIYMDGCIRKMKVRVRDLGARLNVIGVEQLLVKGFMQMPQCC